MFTSKMKLGLLKVGVPQPWEKSKKNLNYVREAGVRQFISTYNRVKNLKGDELLWGDEVEYGIFILDDENKKIRLSLRAKEVCVYIMLVYNIVRFECSHPTQNIISIELLRFITISFLFRLWTISIEMKRYIPTKTRGAIGFQSMEPG